ncbi:pyruvate dehydrogenase phosphatase regulatory subunit, mitochondrial [Ischnura elegans]|uniref:pyruvate dehydrogenase phosphatase regulatory subunit, mitochondrial n=1 Tax=Ischnura elegans TaxID=197161 RepID=UPI001ED8AFF0|nr:pyruvate dehydrogenase phosphatase regulatory subunit, mitochondrial [Ischnura elegans]
MFRKRLYSITSSSPLCKGKTSSLRTTQAIGSDTSSSHNEEFSNFPKSAKVVICGSGVQGAAVAYHLAKMGWGKETVVLDQGKIGNVTSWLSSGLIGMFKPSRPETKLAQYSIKMYKEMEAAGLETGWKQCGSLLLARTIDRMTMLKKMKALSRARDIDCDVITPEEAQKLCPLIAIDDLKGGLWIPGDGIGDPYKLCLSLASAAEKEGVTLIENCAVQRIINEGGKVVAVDTSKGLIECDYFVNCGGFWARKIGQMSEPFVKVPLHPCEHYYLHTKTIPGLDPMTPVVRDQDGHIYFRENEGRLMTGGFEPVAKPAFEDGNIPDSFDQRRLPADWDHFHILLEQLLHRVPSMKDAALERLCNGPEAFSPDCKWIVGEAPEIQNYFVAAGMKTVGIAAAGGVGKVTADWIVNGYSEIDMYELDIRRFLGLHNNRKFLRDRAREVPGIHYRIAYPFWEFKTGRNLRMSPIYPNLKEAGAVFGQVMGYERPSWFDLSEDEVDEVDGTRPYRIAYTNTFSKPPWFDIVKEEYSACREAVGLSDYSSFTKFDLWSRGTEVVDSLQYLCSNDVDIPIGGIIHTGMQNKLGGYENDCSLARVAENHYMLIAPTIQQTRCKVWIQKHLPSDGSVVLSDVTSMYTAICIMGPLTRALLSELADVDLNPKYFPFFTFKKLDVGLASGIRVMNLTHTGELGYVLYIPNEFALHVYAGLIEVGKKYGLRHAGYYAMRALRIEKFYAFWGQDIDSSTTPLECGRAFRVKFNKDIDFIGKEALMKQREEGVKRMYIQLILEDDYDHEVDVWPSGRETIYRDGKYVGVTTTTGFGFTLGRQICLGFIQNFDDNGIPQEVTNDYVMSGDYEVDIAGIRYSAKVNLHSPNLPTKYPELEKGRYMATREDTQRQAQANVR